MLHSIYSENLFKERLLFKFVQCHFVIYAIVCVICIFCCAKICIELGEQGLEFNLPALDRDVPLIFIYCAINYRDAPEIH